MNQAVDDHDHDHRASAPPDWSERLSSVREALANARARLQALGGRDHRASAPPDWSERLSSVREALANARALQALGGRSVDVAEAVDQLTVEEELLQVAQRFGWIEVEYQHALDQANTKRFGGVEDYGDYGDETAILLANGREIRCPAYPEECDYVRIVQEGHELAHWTSSEWEEDGPDVMGAFLGAARGHGNTLTVKELQESLQRHANFIERLESLQDINAGLIKAGETYKREAEVAKRALERSEQQAQGTAMQIIEQAALIDDLKAGLLKMAQADQAHPNDFGRTLAQVSAQARALLQRMGVDDGPGPQDSEPGFRMRG